MFWSDLLLCWGLWPFFTTSICFFVAVASFFFSLFIPFTRSSSFHMHALLHTNETAHTLNNKKIIVWAWLLKLLVKPTDSIGPKFNNFVLPEHIWAYLSLLKPSSSGVILSQPFCWPNFLYSMILAVLFWKIDTFIFRPLKDEITEMFR